MVFGGSESTLVNGDNRKIKNFIRVGLDVSRTKSWRRGLKNLYLVLGFNSQIWDRKSGIAAFVFLGDKKLRKSKRRLLYARIIK